MLIWTFDFIEYAIVSEVTNYWVILLCNKTIPKLDEFLTHI